MTGFSPVRNSMGHKGKPTFKYTAFEAFQQVMLNSQVMETAKMPHH
jgi:hypothetical protein